MRSLSLPAPLLDASRLHFLSPKDTSPSQIQRGHNLFAILGLQVAVKEERAEELAELAEYLQENFPQYGPGAHYLLQLAGKVAVQRTQPRKLDFLLAGPLPGAQRGHALLRDPEPHNIRRLRVKFHRYY